MSKMRLAALLLIVGLSATNAFAQGPDLVLSTVSGMSKSDADLTGEGRDMVLSTAGMRPSEAALAGEGRDTYLSTDMAPQPKRKSAAQPQESLSDIATLAYIAHATGRSIPGSATSKSSATSGTTGSASN